MLALTWGVKVFLKITWVLSRGDTIVTHGNAMGVPLAIYSARLRNYDITGKPGKRKYKIVHMESGLRGNTGATRLLDAIYKFADKRSDTLFTPFNSTRKNLRSEEIKGKIILSGDVMKDVVRETLKIKPRTKNPKSNYVLASITRSIITKHDALQLLHAIRDSQMKTILILNPVIKNRIHKFGLSKLLVSDNIELMKPTDYPAFLNLLNNSKGAITDSTGVEEECAVLGKPCISTNDFLQIPELAESGVVRKAGCNYIAILGGLRKIKGGYWKVRKNSAMVSGSPTKRVADYLTRLERGSR